MLAFPYTQLLLLAFSYTPLLLQVHALLSEAVSMMRGLEDARGAGNPASLHELGQSGASSTLNKASLERLDKYKHDMHSQPLPACYQYNDMADMDKTRATQRFSAAADNLISYYPAWSKGTSIPGKRPESIWRQDRGPPYIKRLTMYTGPGVDTKHSGNLVRRVLGLTTAFQKPCDDRSCQDAMSGNQYLKTFAGPQFRFLYRSTCSSLVIPPLVHGAGPVLKIFTCMFVCVCVCVCLCMCVCVCVCGA